MGRGLNAMVTGKHVWTTLDLTPQLHKKDGKEVK
jgi:hypothetical protein